MKPRRRRILVAVTILVSAATFGWFVWLPHFRPALRSGERYGIDVSHHQGVIDWLRVKGAGISFAYIKASEGTDVRDPRFRANWGGARSAGIDTGAYHFFNLCSPGRAQADNFVEAAPPDHEAWPPAVDLEIAGNCSAPPPARVLEREIMVFLDRVESEWNESAVLYIGDDFAHRYAFTSSMRELRWVRRFLRRPTEKGWFVWQVSGWAHVDGIDGDVDLDVMAPPRPRIPR